MHAANQNSSRETCLRRLHALIVSRRDAPSAMCEQALLLLSRVAVGLERPRMDTNQSDLQSFDKVCR